MIEIALTAQVLLWIALLALVLWSGQSTVFHPANLYLAFHGLVFVLRPILVHSLGFRANWEYMRFEPDEEVFLRTLAVSSAGLVCFVAASVWAGWVTPAFPSGRPVFSAAERRAFALVVFLLLPLIAWSVYSTRNGIQGERVNGIYIMTNSTGYLNEAQHFALPLLCMGLAISRFSIWNAAPVAAYIGYRTWFGWSRWTILLFLLMAVLTYCWIHRRRWLPLWSIAAALPVLLLFNLLGHNRELIRSALDGTPITAAVQDPGLTPEEKLRRQFDTQDYANFDYLAYVVAVVPQRSMTYTHGAQYLQLFTEPVPRLLWKGKPVGAPVRTGVNLSAYGNFVGLTVSLVGDGWMSGGWVGLVVTLGLAGAILGRGHRWFWEGMHRNWTSLVFIVGVSMSPQWFRDGGISIAKFLLFTLSPVLLWGALVWILRGRPMPVFTAILWPGDRLRVRRAGAPEGPGRGPRLELHA